MNGFDVGVVGGGVHGTAAAFHLASRGVRTVLGFKLAPMLGKHVPDLIQGADVDPGLAQFHPRRFAEHQELGAGYGDARILG